MNENGLRGSKIKIHHLSALIHNICTQANQRGFPPPLVLVHFCLSSASVRIGISFSYLRLFQYFNFGKATLSKVRRNFWQ
jgi:hypothetical protein